MTYKEALKVIDLNKDKLCGSMQEATRKASFSHRLNNTYPPKGYRIPGSDECGFQKGVTPLERLGKRKNDARSRRAQKAVRRPGNWSMQG